MREVHLSESRDSWDQRLSVRLKQLLAYAKEYAQPNSHHRAEALKAAREYLESQNVFYNTYPHLDIQAEPLEINALITLLDDARLQAHGKAAENEQLFATAQTLNHRNRNALISRRLNAIYFRRETKTGSNTPKFWDYLRDHFPQYRQRYLAILLKHQRLVFIPGDSGFLDEALAQNSELLDDMSDAEILELRIEEDDSDVCANLKDRVAADILFERHNDPNIPRPKNVSNDAIVTLVAPGLYGTFDTVGRLQQVFSTSDTQAKTLSEAIQEAHIDHPGIDTNFLAANLSTLIDLRFRDHLKQDYHIDLAKLTLREQIALLRTLETTDKDTDRRQMQVIQTHGLEAARAFLSCENDPEFRQTLFTLAQGRDHETIAKIFAAYAEITAVAQTTLSDIATQSLRDAKQTIDEVALQRELLSRAKTLLTRTATAPAEDVVKALEAAKVDTVLLASICKTYFQAYPEARPEDIAGLHKEAYAAGEIDEAAQREMLDIYNQNWSKQLPEYAHIGLQDLKEKLQTRNPDITFHIYKKDGKVIAFYRIDRNRTDFEAGSLYFGSFNVTPDLRGAMLGQAILKSEIERLAETQVIYGEATIHFPMTAKYIEDSGAVAVDIHPFRLPDDSDIHDLVLRWSPANSHYQSKQHERVTDIAHEPDITILRIDLKSPNAVAELQKKFAQGLVITRFTIDPQNPNGRLVIFEKIISA